MPKKPLSLCQHCDHFVEENPYPPEEIVRKNLHTMRLKNKSLVARYVHLDDGEQEFDHDAYPGEMHFDNAWEALRPDLFQEHADGKIGPNSSFHDRRGKTDDFWSDAAVFHRQKVWPIFITNGCCEPAHASPAIFTELGLEYQPKGIPGDYDNWGGDYPLTKKEEKYIREDCTDGPHGGVAMAYSVLYQGKKWLAPLVEICFLTGRFSKESYGGTEFDNSISALAAAYQLVAKVKSRIEALGGHVILIEKIEDDRHNVLFLFPPEFAAKKAANVKEWSEWITAFLA